MLTTISIDRFHCQSTKNSKIGNFPVEEAKKMKLYKRLIYKQVSGLCGPQFLSYLSKRFITFLELFMDTPYWCTVLVHQYGRRKPTKTSGVHFSYLFTWELAYVRINISSNTWNGYTDCWKSRRQTFFHGDRHYYFGVTHCENSEVQIAVFTKWNMLQEGKLVQRFTFCLSST